ncbi:hypothetical protein [Streptomyces sp.]|uniref:hypothetical protein n=1 Tax=Streptomyces sp. TaxID=1931 RepID=UPI002F929175
MAKPVTTEQLLNLADRAERGPLSADEASRLRTGITQLHDDRRSLRSRLRVQTRQLRRDTEDLTGIRNLVVHSQRRRIAHIPVWSVVAILRGTRPEEAA